MKTRKNKLKEIYEKMLLGLSKWWVDNRFLLKPCLVMIAIYLIGISAIILSGVRYADDVARTNHGYAGWSGFSRYLSTILSHGLHADNYLTNIYPWPQILAIIILAISSIMMICLISGKDIFKKKWTIWIWPIIAVIPLALSPYMLECLSYQYDAPYMAISVLFAILPLMRYKKRDCIYYGLVAVGVLVICMTYQAAIGIMPMMVVLLAMKEWANGKGMKNKEIWKFVLCTALVFVVTLIFFQKFLMRTRDVYVSNNLPEIGSFFPMFFEHLRQYFELVVTDFRMLWKVLIVIMIGAAIVLYTFRSQKSKVLSCVVAIIGVFLMGALSLAIYAALEKPLYATRAMYAVGAFIAMIGVTIVSGRYAGWFTRLPVAILGYVFVMFALTYGNALREQEIFRDSRVEMVIADLNKLQVMKTEGLKVVGVEGDVGLSPVIRHMPIEDYRVLYRLMMPSFSENVPWMAYRISQQPWYDNIYYDPNIELTEKHLPVLVDTVLYTISGNEKYILITFKNDVVYDLIY